MRSSSCALRSTYLIALTWTSSLFSRIRADRPRAISVTFDPDYLGYDGQWSPAQIRVGSPEQYLSVFPSTTSSETRVAGPDFCDGTSTCASLRGGLFYSDNSTTWQPIGQFGLGYSALSQSTDNGIYGFDNISISDTIVTSDQIIAITDGYDHWNGQLGLGVQETRFSNTTNNLAFISTLVQNNSAIPGHSYGYTAGAFYQNKGVLGSLTLGGVDSTRYIPNNTSFTLGPGYTPSVAIKSIQVAASSAPSAWTTNPLQLMSPDQAAVFTVDSSTPYLWLPEPICDSIAGALNLVWNASTQLYFFNDSATPQDLVDRDLEFTFNLANDATSSEVLALKLSYGAFNLQLSYPFPGLFTEYSEAKINYFPLRRANNSQQYTIGRAFLQETYLVVDYERNVFSLSQALFPSSSQQPVIASITRPHDSTWPGPGGKMTSSSLSTAAKVGIAVGTAIAAAAVTASLWLCRLKMRRRQQFSNDGRPPNTGLLSIFSRRPTQKSPMSTSVTELGADKRHPIEIGSDPSNSRFELSAVGPVEMAAAAVAPTFFQFRNNTHIAQLNDPRSPIELNQALPRGSMSKDELTENENRVRSKSPAPAYEPVAGDQQNLNGISPHTLHYSVNPFQDSSDDGVSPITGISNDPGHLSQEKRLEMSNGSSGFLSPISSVQARCDGPGFSHSSSGGADGRRPSLANVGATYTTLPSTARSDQVLRRSPSLGSWAREERNVRQESDDQPMPSNSGLHSHFSWEA